MDEGEEGEEGEEGGKFGYVHDFTNVDVISKRSGMGSTKDFRNKERRGNRIPKRGACK